MHILKRSRFKGYKGLTKLQRVKKGFINFFKGFNFDTGVLVQSILAVFNYYGDWSNYCDRRNSFLSEQFQHRCVS